MTFETRMNLIPAQFAECERPLASFGSLAATTFRFPSGVCALRLENAHGALTLLPFQGQQVWSAEFGGDGSRRTLTMRSMVAEPKPTLDFLATFGGFLQHCGVIGAGVPAAEDTHPLHGELPNAPYQVACLVTGQDENGPYMAMGGRYRHTVAFAHDYVAEPLVKLYADAPLCHVSMTITNLKRSNMEVMYLAHVNFRPVDNGRLVYSAPRTPEHVRVRTSLPTHIRLGPDYVDFVARLQQNPTLHETLAADLPFDPEAVFFIDYVADEKGWAHTMQIHPDGSADYIGHKPEQLPRATRWISRTPDQDAMAMVEAGTCETEGYQAEKAKGNIVTLGPGEQFYCTLAIGMLPPAEADRLERHIEAQELGG